MSLENDEQLAARAIEEGAYVEAARLLRPLAERNSDYALLALGWMYETGATGAADKDAARNFYEHAISQGSPTACLYLGWLLQNWGDEAGARAAFELGAQRNEGECKAELVRMADNARERFAGRLIQEERFEEAVRLLRPLVERNSEYALLALGYIYETGKTGLPDTNAARSCYERAAAQGVPPHIPILGGFY